jgi:hypothetical protein
MGGLTGLVLAASGAGFLDLVIYIDVGSLPQAIYELAMRPMYDAVEAVDAPG